MSEPMKPTAEEHELLLRLNPELARYGSNSLWYNFAVKDRGRKEAASFKRAQEVLAIVRPILQERDRLREALRDIVQWADAYPLATFPEPNFKRAAKALSDAGMTLDAISASNMRHAIEGAGRIAREALGEAEDR